LHKKKPDIWLEIILVKLLKLYFYVCINLVQRFKVLRNGNNLFKIQSVVYLYI